MFLEVATKDTVYSVTLNSLTLGMASIDVRGKVVTGN